MIKRDEYHEKDEEEYEEVVIIAEETEPEPGTSERQGFLLPPYRDRDAGKKTLILDLDETLIHSSFEPLAHADIILDLHLE
jgi:RNA polymerase II subunit A small phosphatase-like protein